VNRSEKMTIEAEKAAVTYDEALEMASKKKGKAALVELDKYVTNSYEIM
jgi:hypothetical protein